MNTAKSDDAFALFMKSNLPHLETEERYFMTEGEGEYDDEDFILMAVDGDKLKDKKDEKEIIEIVKESIEEICLNKKEGGELELLINCGCPTTVAGEDWIMKFIQNLSEEDKKKIVVRLTKRWYRFGSGERRQKALFMGNVVEMKRVKSGHYSIDIDVPKNLPKEEKGAKHLESEGDKKSGENDEKYGIFRRI